MQSTKSAGTALDLEQPIAWLKVAPTRKYSHKGGNKYKPPLVTLMMTRPGGPRSYGTGFPERRV